MAFHEGRACDAVIRVLEAREGHDRRDVRSPEREGHAAPIELICLIGDRLFAFEHTGIEPFAGHVKFEAEARRHFDPIREMLSGKLPSEDVFELHVPAMVMQGKRRREIDQIQAALVSWVEATAPTVRASRYASYDRSIRKVKPPGVPFDVTLYRFLPAIPHSGYLQIKHAIDGNIEEARADRLREACRRKFPKLARWKRDHGARTVLILEDNDLQLTNSQRVYDAYSRVERPMTDQPDEIYMVSTMIESPWFVHALRIADRSYYELSEAQLCMTELDANTLVDLTGRGNG
jgi:hypothetical protein